MLYPGARFLGSAPDPGQFLPDDGVEVAFAGRSNSGKSSAINAIIGRRHMARTSRTPGRTQLVNFFALGAGQRLVDLPGYGFARVPRRIREHWGALVEAYFAGRQSLTGLFLVVDVRRGLTAMDRQMLEWVAALGCPIHVLLTKCDKLSPQTAQQCLASATGALGPDITAQLFSAHDGTGVTEARERLGSLLCRKKNASGAEYRGTPEANRTGLG